MRGDINTPPLSSHITQLPQFQQSLDSLQGRVRNVPLDPIAQHTDMRARPKIYESLIMSGCIWIVPGLNGLSCLSLLSSRAV